MPTTTSSSSSSGGDGSTSNSLMTYANDFVGFLLLPFTIIWGLITSFIGIGTNSSASANSSALPGSGLNRQRSSQGVSQPPVNDNIRFLNKYLLITYN